MSSRAGTRSPTIAVSGWRRSLLAPITRLAARLASVAVFLMMLTGAADVLGTAVGRPLPGAFELTETLMVACVFLALALAQREGKHIRVEVLPNLSSPRVRRGLDLLAGTVSALFYAGIAFYAWRELAGSLVGGEFAAGIVRFALWPARLALALGASLMALQAAADAVDHARGR